MRNGALMTSCASTSRVSIKRKPSSNATAPTELWATSRCSEALQSAGVQRLVTPLVNPIEATVNMSVFFSVRLEQAPARSCSATNPFTNGGQETSLRMEVQAGSSTYTSTVQQVIEAVSNDDSELFEGERLEVNLSMQPGEAFTLSLWMQHDCEGTRARVLWGGFEQNAGGIVIEGDIYEPSATLKVDASRRARSRSAPTFHGAPTTSIGPTAALP